MEEYVEKAIAKCMQLNKDLTGWEGKGLKITNIGEGEQLTDVSILKQTCTFDSSVMNFKCGNRYFNLVENSANEQLVCLTTNAKGDEIFAVYGSEKQEALPASALKWDVEKQAITDYKNKELIWDEENKKFQYIDDLKVDPSTIKMVSQTKETHGKTESVWNGRNKRIVNLAAGQDSDDACIMKQVVVYDKEKKVFKCGSDEFDLVINKPNAPIVVLNDPRGAFPELMEYGTQKKVKYVSMMQWDWRRAGVNHLVRDYKERRIVWNEETKGFALAEDIVNK